MSKNTQYCEILRWIEEEVLDYIYYSGCFCWRKRSFFVPSFDATWSTTQPFTNRLLCRKVQCRCIGNAFDESLSSIIYLVIKLMDHDMGWYIRKNTIFPPANASLNHNAFNIWTEYISWVIENVDLVLHSYFVIWK